MGSRVITAGPWPDLPTLVVQSFTGLCEPYREPKPHYQLGKRSEHAWLQAGPANSCLPGVAVVDPSSPWLMARPPCADLGDADRSVPCFSPVLLLLTAPSSVAAASARR
jgi:hypothetical protein